MRKSRFSEEQMVGILREADRDPVPQVAKRRGVIPGEWSVKLFQKYGLNPRFVYDGLPPVFLSPAREGGLEAPQDHEPSFLLKYPEGALLALRMPDSSMEPVIARDAFVGVNTGDKWLDPGG